jgi:hypothetical protein
LPDGFSYTSNGDREWLSPVELRALAGEEQLDEEVGTER